MEVDELDVGKVKTMTEVEVVPTNVVENIAVRGAKDEPLPDEMGAGTVRVEMEPLPDEVGVGNAGVE